MDYEKKYKEALERAKQFSEKPYLEDSKGIVEYIFPELVESEDERIRKSLIDMLKNDEKCYLKEIAWLEKQGEKNPVDKVEPKFEIEKGKWYVCNTSRYTDFVVGKAYYCPKNGMLKPNENEMARYVAKHHFRLWTVEDAKDGDVLYNKDDFAGNSVFIYKGISDKTHACLYYTRLFKDKDFSIYNDVMWENGVGVSGGEFYPATKEQRDTLMKAMADAGYIFDFEKKELKKIEQKPAWSEEDEDNLTDIFVAIDNFHTTNHKKELITFLKSLKDRYAWKPSDEQIKVCKEVYADILSAKGFDLGTVNGELNRLEEELKKLREK